MTTLRRTLLLSAAFPLLATAAPPPAGRSLPVFAAAPAAAVLARWQPLYDSAPPRIDTPPPENTPVLTLPADFAKAGTRACWDRHGPLDLSRAERVCFQWLTTNRRVTGTVGIYFGTPTGWYARFIGPTGPAGAWQQVILDLADFKTEDRPGGWDRVDRFRFSVWAAAPGKALFRLRDLRILPADPAENRIRNGSFEIHGGGMPYAWGSGHWGIGRMPWAADMALWRRHWRLDSTTAHEGKTSLRIENSPGLPRLEAWSVWFSLPKTHATWTASAWLKADRDALPVRIQCGQGGATLRIGRAWCQAAFHLPPGKRLRFRVTPQAPGAIWIDAVQVQAGATATPEFHAAFDDDAIAAREARVDWSPPRRTPQIARGRRIHGPIPPATVRIDEHGRFLVNGKPYLQHSLGLEFVSDPAILDFAARSGFKDVCLQIRPGISTAELKSRFDCCAHDGLRVIPWLDGRIPIETFQNHIRTLKNHPALLCWYVYDEPHGAKFAEAEKRLALARKLDPAHPAYINYLGNHLENQAGAIYSTDVYPIPRSGPFAAIRAVQRMAAAARKERKPVWMWLQGAGYAYSMAREPTPRELSCMAYGSLIAGARGIYYFAQIPRTKACFDEMRALCVELDTVAPWLYSLTKAPAVSCDQGAVMCRAWRRHGAILVLAVNTGAAPAPAAGFTLAPAPAATAAAVWFEGRNLPVTNGRWRDAFGPYERRVYRLPP